MNVAFRCDASREIGTGHVMRCLTLADEIRRRGGACLFVARALEGNINAFIASRGHAVAELPAAAQGPDPATTGYAAWLTVSKARDAAETAAALDAAAFRADWLTVDHYALDREWEAALAARSGRLFVVDDLADRPHDCDLLLDQTLGRAPGDYAALTPPGAVLLCGAAHALLRPEFSHWRPASLARRSAPVLDHILVSLGGVDKDNVTRRILETLEGSDLPARTRITTVMGRTAPWRDDIAALTGASRFDARVLCGVDDMARLMSEADLAIGAVGATSWERCALGLPALVTVLAENQAYSAARLEEAGAVLTFGFSGGVDLTALIGRLRADPSLMARMSARAAAITDGTGCGRVADRLFQAGDGL